MEGRRGRAMTVVVNRSPVPLAAAAASKRVGGVAANLAVRKGGKPSVTYEVVAASKVPSVVPSEVVPVVAAVECLGLGKLGSVSSGYFCDGRNFRCSPFIGQA